MLVYRDREKFSSVSEAEVKRVFEPLNPLGLEPLTLGQEGFKVRLWNGRIDCLLEECTSGARLLRKFFELLTGYSQMRTASSLPDRCQKLWIFDCGPRPEVVSYS